MKSKDIRKIVPYLDRKTFESDRKTVLALAVLLIISGISAMIFYAWFYCTYADFGGDVPHLLWVLFKDSLDKILLVVSGAMIYRYRDRIPLYWTVAAVAIVLGLYQLFGLTPIYDGLGIFDYLLEVTSIVMIFGLIAFGILVWVGYSKYTSALGFISMFYVAYEILTFRFDMLLMMNGLQIAMFVVPFIPYTALMFTFCYACFRRSVMPPSIIKRMTESGRRIIDTGYTEDDTYLLRADLKEMCGLFDAPSERDDGIIDIERCYRLITPLRSRTMTVRRLTGEDFLRAYVGSETGSFTGFRFQIRKIMPDNGSLDDCGLVSIYGEPGMFVRIRIRDREMSFQELSAEEFEEEKHLRAH